MKAYMLLLKLNLTNLVAGLRGGSFRKDNGKLDLMRMLLMITAFIGVAALIGTVIFIEYVLYRAIAPMGQQRLLLGLTVLLSMIVTLMFSVFHMLAAMYFNRDSVNLAHLPVSSRAVMAAKWTEVYIPEALLSAGMLMPLIILHGVDIGAGMLYYLRAALMVLSVPLYPLALSLLLSSLLGRMTSLTRHKEVWVVIGTIVMLVLVLGSEWMLLPTIPEDADALFFIRLVMNHEAMLQAMIGGFPPVMWSVHALDGSWIEWLMFIALGIVLICGLICLLGKSYMDVCIRHTEQGIRKRTGRRKTADFTQRTPLMALFWREMNEVLKVPVYLLNGVMGVLMMPIVMGGMMAGIAASEDMELVFSQLQELLNILSQLDLTLILAALFSLICGITPVISTSVSREGRRLAITRMIPVPARVILNAKLLVNLFINGVGALVMAVVIVCILGAAYIPHVTVALVLLNLLSYATSVANLAIDVSRPLLNWKNETQVMKQNMNQMIGMLISLVLMAAAIAPPFFLLSCSSAMRMAAVVIVLLLECSVCFLLMRKVVEPRYAALEP